MLGIYIFKVRYMISYRNVGLILLSRNSCGSSIVIFNELFITFRTLYGPRNLGISFCALCFGNAKFLVDKYTKSFVWYSMLGLQDLLE